MNAVNQTGPLGSLTYNQTGTWADGTPRYEANSSLSGPAQGVMSNAFQALSGPVDLSNEAVEGRLYDLGSKRLNPQLQQRRVSTEQDLLNRGVRPGTEAYNNAMSLVGQGENDAWNQLVLQGRGQSVNEILAGRGQNLNELQTVLGANQGTRVNTPGTSLQAPDLIGLTNNQYNAQQSGYNANMNALGQVAGAVGQVAGGWAASDRRIKDDIDRVGETDDGLGIYTYRRKGSPLLELGLMAQEVEREKPRAARTLPSGLKQVNYREALR